MWTAFFGVVESALRHRRVRMSSRRANGWVNARRSFSEDNDMYNAYWQQREHRNMVLLLVALHRAEKLKYNSTDL